MTWVYKLLFNCCSVWHVSIYWTKSVQVCNISVKFCPADRSHGCSVSVHWTATLSALTEDCCQLLYHAADWETTCTSHTRNRSSIKVFLAILRLPATLRTITSICRQRQNKTYFSKTGTDKCCSCVGSHLDLCCCLCPPVHLHVMMPLTFFNAMMYCFRSSTAE